MNLQPDHLVHRTCSANMNELLEIRIEGKIFFPQIFKE